MNDVMNIYNHQQAMTKKLTFCSRFESEKPVNLFIIERDNASPDAHIHTLLHFTHPMTLRKHRQPTHGRPTRLHRLCQSQFTSHQRVYPVAPYQNLSHRKLKSHHQMQTSRWMWGSAWGDVRVYVPWLWSKRRLPSVREMDLPGPGLQSRWAWMRIGWSCLAAPPQDSPATPCDALWWVRRRS